MTILDKLVNQIQELEQNELRKRQETEKFYDINNKKEDLALLQNFEQMGLVNYESNQV